MKKLIIIILIAAATYQWTATQQNEAPSIRTESTPTTTHTQRSAKLNSDAKSNNDIRLRTAFENRQSNVQVNGSGIVTRILADDNEGSRHQRFILRLASGQTILIAHNIDLAARISSLSNGDQVQFYGEYEWNPKGGVVHWTHHDPNGRHVGGWLKHNGRTYQ